MNLNGESVSFDVTTLDHQLLLSAETVSIEFRFDTVFNPRIKVTRIETRIEDAFLEILPKNKNDRVKQVNPIMELDRHVGYPTK